MTDEEEKFWQGLEGLRKEMKELKESMKDTDRRMKETDRRIGKLTDGWGRFVEGIVSPSAGKIFSKKGYKIRSIYHRVEVREDNQVIVEFDTLLEANKNGKDFLFIGEAKSFCQSSDIKEFIKELDSVHKYLPRYKECKIIGFIAATNFAYGADKFAIKNGIYILKPSGETMILSVPKGFRPKIWGEGNDK